jgi:hypothetical protein
MVHRTPTSDDDPTVVHEVTERFEFRVPEPGSYQPGRNGYHYHDGKRELHPQGDRPHYHDSQSGIVVFFDDSAAPAPNGAATEVDPPPAGVPDPGEVSESSAPASSRTGAGSDAAGAGRPRDHRGRFIGTSRTTPQVPATLPVSVALEHALIDADAATFLATQHAKLRMARVLVDAIAFGVEAERCETAAGVYAGMLVRLPENGDAA